LTYEFQLILLIYILYLSKSIILIDEEDNFVEYYKSKFNLLFANGNIRLKNKKVLILNPLLFFSPIFFIDTNKKNQNQKKIYKKNRLIITILNKMIPTVFVLSIIELIVFPFSLIYQHMGLVIFSISALYISLFVLIIQVWFFKNDLNLSSKKLIAISLEYIFCPPFAINNIRNISIIKLQEKGKLK